MNNSANILLVRKTNCKNYRSIGNSHKTAIKYFITNNNLHFQCHVVSTVMKLILPSVVLVVFLILLNCDDALQSKVIINTNKSRKLFPKSVKLVNAKKYQKYGGLHTLKPNVRKKFFESSYTVFPETRLKELQLTERFYIDPYERKSRVKKVLPAYQIPILRRKRNAPTNAVLESKSLKKNEKTNKESTKKKNKNKNIKRKPSLKKARKAPKRRLRKKNKQTNRSKKVKKTNAKTRINKDENKKKTKLRNSENKVRTRRLIAARDALIAEFPYMVSIQKSGEHWCSGAILNPRLVITTANCIWKSNQISRMRVRAGSTYTNTGGQVVKIQEVMKHPRWNIRSTPDNDLGLLFLAKNIKFSDSVHAADLPNRNMLPPFDDAWVTSWGSQRRDGVFEQSSDPLQVYHAEFMSLEKCNNVTHRFGVSVTNNFICLTQTGRRAPCTRDTGAPATSDGILWGVASWGIRKLCGTERFPAMFSYIASPSNMDFIINATHYFMSDERHYPYPDRFVFKAKKPSNLTTISLM